MQNTFYLNQDERCMLRDLFSVPAGAEQDTANVPFSARWRDIKGGDSAAMLTQLIQFLEKADHLVLQATYGEYKFSFNLSLGEDQWGQPQVLFAPPLIQDLSHSHSRAWRTHRTSGIHLTDQNGKPMNWHIRNLSATGMLLDGPVPPLPPGTRFQAYLRAPDMLAIPICGQIIRQEELDDEWRRCAVRLHLNAQTRYQLNQYLYRQHRQENPIQEKYLAAC